MRKLLLLIFCLALPLVAVAADAAIAGKWDVTATDVNGNKILLDMLIQDHAGQLSGKLILKSGDATIEVLKPKFGGDTFTFQIDLNGDLYSLECKVSGDKLVSGKYQGPQASGTFEGTRISSLSVAGIWNATATDENGVKNEVVVTIKEDGGKLSGTINLKDQGLTLPLVEPKVDGNRLQFKIMINDSPYQVDAKVDGLKIEGSFAGPEASGTIKGSKAS